MPWPLNCPLRVHVDLFNFYFLSLSLIENEQVQIHVNTPIDILPSNIKFHAFAVKKINAKPFLLHTDNYSANGSKDATLNSINQLLYSRINMYLLWRFTSNSFDTDIFKEDLFENVHKHTELSLCSDEIQLLSNYCAIVSYARRHFLEILGDYVPPIEIPKMICNDWYAPLTPDDEKKILDKSSSIGLAV